MRHLPFPLGAVVATLLVACSSGEFASVGARDSGLVEGGSTGGHSNGGANTGGGSGRGGVSGSGGGSGSGGANGGTSGRGNGGGSGTGGAGGGSGSTCGGFIGQQCPGTEWCDYDDATGACGIADASGVCRARPTACTKEYRPVCGCDGALYSNPCMANAAGVDTTPDTSCMPGDGGAGTNCSSDSDCRAGLKCCYPCGIPGCQNQCMQVSGPGCPAFP